MPRDKKITIIVIVALAAGIALLLWAWNRDRTAPGGIPTAREAGREYQQDLPATGAQPVPEEPGQAMTNGTAPPAEAVGPRQPAEPESVEIVTPGFILDLARYAAANYHPPRTRHNEKKQGISTLSFKKLNMRYGVTLTGLDVETGDVDKAREMITNLIMDPKILESLYGLFAKDLTEALVLEGLSQTRAYRSKGGEFTEKPMTPENVREMLSIYSWMTRDTGLVFAAFAADPKMTAAMHGYFLAEARVLAAYSEFAALEAEGRTGEALSRVSVEIRDSILAREALKTDILARIRPKDKSFSLSDGEVMDVASWCYRRAYKHEDRLPAIKTMAGLFEKFSKELEKAAKSSDL